MGLCVNIESVYCMTESSENQNGDYERERVEVNKTILYAIQGFSRHTIQASIVTFAITVLYMPILLIHYETGVKKCIIETGTSIPLFILTSTVIIEVKGRIMDWVEIRRAKRRDQERQREAQIFANGENQGETKTITALQAASKEGLTLEQALEQYESKNGKKT